MNAEQLLGGDELQGTEDLEELQSILFNSIQLLLSIRTSVHAQCHALTCQDCVNTENVFSACTHCSKIVSDF